MDSFSVKLPCRPSREVECLTCKWVLGVQKLDTVKSGSDGAGQI